MSILNSSLTKIYLAGIAVANSTNVSLTVNNAVIDITNKDSAGWREILAGLREWSMSGDCVVDFSDTKGPDDVFSLINGRTAVTVKYKNSTSGEKYYTGSGYITSFTLNHGTEESPTYSFEIQGTSTLTEATLT